MKLLKMILLVALAIIFSLVASYACNTKHEWWSFAVYIWSVTLTLTCITACVLLGNKESK